MPVPPQRDPAVSRERLVKWLEATVPGASDVWVSEVNGPAATGYSNETLLFDARWHDHDGRHAERLVARVKPTQYSIFLESEFEAQYRVMRALHEHTDVPMPRLHWFEPDGSWLGAPFWVMDRVDGRAPADNPPYTLGGWLQEAGPDQQARLWWTGLEAMAGVHRADWRALGLGFLDRPARGRTGIDQQLAYYEEYLAWASAGRPQPIAEAAFEWVKANRPTGGEPLGLCWGDARIGNILFDDFRPAAVLDWEMVTLGNPVQDLGWWLFLERHFTEGLAVAPLPGFPGRHETVARWEDLTGLRAEHLDYYEVFAAFRFAVIMMRVAQMAILYELIPPDSDMESNNIVTHLLARMLELPPPGEDRGGW